MISVTVNLNHIDMKINMLANLLGKKSKTLDGILWYAGDIMRGHCIDAANTLIYDTPESKSYKRTRFLKSSIFVTTKQKNDYHDVRAYAMSLPPITYPDMADWEDTYQMDPFTPFTGGRGVRVTAGAWYSADVEYGNNPRGARPFMRTGLGKSSEEAQRVVRESVILAVQRLYG